MPSLCTVAEAHQLMAIDTEDSPFSTLSSVTKGTMAEDLILDNRAGWNYLKSLPISRRRRKLLMTSEWRSTCSQDQLMARPELKVLEDGCVMIEIDIVRSKAFDLRTAAATYRAVMWGAATGKVKGVMASPPARTEGDEVFNVVFAGGKGRPAVSIRRHPPL